MIVAREFFGNHGYEETSMAMIADAVAIKKPSLYSHYSSKKEIFRDILEKELTDYIRHLRRTLDDDSRSVIETLRNLMKELSLDSEASASTNFYYRYARYQPKELEAYISEEYTRSEELAREIFNMIIERGKRDGEIDSGLSNLQIYSTYFLLVDGLAVMPDFYAKTYQETEFERVWEVFQRGIKPA